MWWWHRLGIPLFQSWRPEGQKFKVVLRHIDSLKPTWVIRTISTIVTTARKIQINHVSKKKKLAQMKNRRDVYNHFTKR